MWELDLTTSAQHIAIIIIIIIIIILARILAMKIFVQAG
jgi:hypothetical protein